MNDKQQLYEENDVPKTNAEHALASEITWRVHPVVESWKRTILLCLFLLSILTILYWGFQSIGVLLFSALLLIGPLYKYFLPFQYHCGTDNLVVSACCYKFDRPWSTYRSYYVDKNGVLLSPFAKPSRLENFRGIYVRFGKHPPEEIVNFIQSKIKPESEHEQCTDKN